MHYGLSEQSFEKIILQAEQGDPYARVFLRLACYTTSSALKADRSRSGQFVLSSDQLERLKALDHSFVSMIDGLAIEAGMLTALEISYVDAETPATSTLQLPKKYISQHALFTTPTWLGDLGSGHYGPSIRFGDLISAWRSEGLALSQLTGIVSIISLEKGLGLMNESHIIGGVGLKGSDATIDPANPRAKVELISPDDWFSLAQFGAVTNTPPTPSEAECLSNALISNDFAAYNDEQAYLVIATVTMGEGTVIRREFSPAAYQEHANTPFALAKDCRQHLEPVPENTRLTILGKIHQRAETGLGGKLDTKIHIHGISPEIMDIISTVNCELLYQDSAEFHRVNEALLQLSQTINIRCGHLKTESGQCYFKSIENIHTIQALPHIIEVNKTGIPPHDLLTGQAIAMEKESMVKNVLSFAIWQQDVEQQAQPKAANTDSTQRPREQFKVTLEPTQSMV